MTKGPAERALLLARALQEAIGATTAEVVPVQDTRQLFRDVVSEPELRHVSEQLFLQGHFALAVEEGFKLLNNLVKRRAGLHVDDGAGLMSKALSLKNPRLKLSDLKTKSKQDQQLGYMFILQGCMTGIRNPRAHEHKYLDEPRNALELLALCNHLLRLVRTSRRARGRGRSQLAKARKGKLMYRRRETYHFPV